MRSLFSAAVLLLATQLLAAPAAWAQTVKVEQPWARATAPHAQTAAVYLTITAGMADRLIGGRTAVAGRVMVHQTIENNGVMRMMEVPGGLQLTAGQAVRLEPGGYHLMLTGLTQQLKQGDRFLLTLHFATEPSMTITVPVAAAGATLAPMATMHMP
jgi:copper(I)-binding protein